MLWIVFEPRPLDPSDAVVLPEPARHRRRVGLVPLTPEGKRLKTLQQQEGIEGRQRGPSVAHADGAAPDDVRVLGEVLDIDDTMETWLRRREHGKAFRVSGPGEMATIHDEASERGAVTTDELGERMDHDVRPVHDGFEQHGGRHRIVDDHRNPVLVGHFADGRNVHDIASGIADRLAKDRPSRPVDERLE